MKPVQVMGDVVRPANVKKYKKKKGVAGAAQNAWRGILYFSNKKVPFFICFAIILCEGACVAQLILQALPQEPSTQPLANVNIQLDSIAHIAQEATAMQTVVAPQMALAFENSSSSASSTVTNASTTPEIKSGLLPTVPVSKFKKIIIATSTVPTASTTSSSSSTAQEAFIAPAIQIKSAPAPVAITPSVITAQSLLASTTVSTTERADGTYKIMFITDAGTYGKLSWDLSRTLLTVSKSLPTFSVSASCDPLPNTPSPDALDQSLMFSVNTSYTCTVDLTPNSGSDERMQSKEFPFTTGRGQLVVTAPSSLNTVLTDGTNSGGFNFRNDDSQPVTITGVDIDVSYTGLNVALGPLILRFEDPATETSLADQHLESLPAAGSSQYAHAATDIHIPLSFTINGGSEKMLPIQLLDVHRFSVFGVNPTVSVTLDGITTNQTLNRTILNSVNFSWLCVVPSGAYDPNATSGPYAAGDACH